MAVGKGSIKRAAKAVDSSAAAPAKEVVEKLNEEGYVVAPLEVDDTMAQEMYHINLDDVEDYGIIQTQRSPGVGFIMVVKAKEGKVDAVKAAVEQVLADKVGQAFYPEEKEISESAEVRVDGNLVSLLILNKEVASDAVAKYEELIK